MKRTILALAAVAAMSMPNFAAAASSAHYSGPLDSRNDGFAIDFIASSTSYLLTAGWSAAVKTGGITSGFFGVSVLDLTDPDNPVSFGDISHVWNANVFSGSFDVTGLTLGHVYSLVGSAVDTGNGYFRISNFGADVNPVAVPGPEAGAGLGALTLGGIALYLKRRRKNEALNA